MTLGNATGQQPVFLDAGQSIFVGWYVTNYHVGTDSNAIDNPGNFRVVNTAAFAAYPAGGQDPGSSGDIPIQSGPLQVSIADINRFDGVVYSYSYIMRWEVSNVSDVGANINTLFIVTSQDTLLPLAGEPI